MAMLGVFPSHTWDFLSVPVDHSVVVFVACITSGIANATCGDDPRANHFGHQEAPQAPLPDPVLERLHSSRTIVLTICSSAIWLSLGLCSVGFR